MQDQWANLIAYAWKNPEVLQRLRQDPKAEIKRLQEAQPDGLGDISDIGSGSLGVFPLPELPDGMGSLNQEQLVEFLEENSGIFGIMQTCCL